MPLIDVRNLSKTFRHTRAVDNLSLSVGQGEICGLVGPDGAGKTTTIRLICGALSPDTGHGGDAPVIRIGDYDMLEQTDQARTQIGYLPQRFSMYEDLTVIENLRFFAETRGLPAAQWRPRCMEILKFVDLDQFVNRRAGQLSGGMRQKLGLAVALVHRPPILLLDEPTTGVDPITRQDFWQLIIRLVSEEGIAVLVSTPYMDEAVRCTQVFFMRQGHLLVSGPPDTLRLSLKGRIMEVRGQPLKLIRQVARQDVDVEDAQMFGDRLHLRLRADTSEQVMARLGEVIPAMGGQLTRLRLIPPQLEDVFITLLETPQ